MKEIDKQYMDSPTYGTRLMTAHLKRIGHVVNRKRISRLMKNMGIAAIYPKPKKESWQKKFGKYPYLLNDIEICSYNHVWGTDITYIPVENGYIYMVAVIDIYTRFVLSWRLSNSLESDFCIKALEEAFKFGKPQIMNSDQGVQFTSQSYIKLLKDRDIAISMSGKGRCWDNIFVERFWRTLKYDEVYLNHYHCSTEAYEGIEKFINLYNYKRPHSSLQNCTPWERYNAA